MKKPIQIGEKIYKSKKEALDYYKNILNSYKIGQSLNDDDFDDLFNLLEYEYFSYCEENENIEEEIYNYNKNVLNDFSDDTNSDNVQENMDDEDTKENNEEETVEDLEIKDIRIARFQYNKQCFEVVYDDMSSYCFSYIMAINRQKFSPDDLFNIACKNTIQNDIYSIKKQFFDNNSVKGFVKCQETNKMSKWGDLVVDHRQPNTFSVIVDRFKEVNKIDVTIIEYKSNDNNSIIFENENLNEEFRKYHKEKANLRIVRKECNLSRTGMARIKRTVKDLTFVNDK